MDWATTYYNYQTEGLGRALWEDQAQIGLIYLRSTARHAVNGLRLGSIEVDVKKL